MTLNYFRTLFLISSVLFLQKLSFSQPGKDGDKVISNTGEIVNEFSGLTADASSGDATISVDNSGLNQHGRFSASLAAGDLIMIIQMQGATIQGTIDYATDSISFGNILNYNNCGLYEFQEVKSVLSGTSIELNCPLENNYTGSGKTQIVRVPRYNTLTINSGAELTTDTWDSISPTISKGGILAIEVLSSTVINAGGKMDVSGKGFRGGLMKLYPSQGGHYKYASTVFGEGGEKGESIAGYHLDYNIYGGMYCRGAAANGGGGGNCHNSGGGGGGNAGDPLVWTGNGNPDISIPSCAAGWDLEYAGFSTSTSSGGGKGGYTYADPGGTSLDPLTIPPGFNEWYGDRRRNIGGKGGHALDYSTGRIFLGGGGGSAEANNAYGTKGENGGGIIYIISYDNISGAGEILANGGTALNSIGIDAAGGAGAGGAILLNASGTITGITIKANGGKGGDQIKSPLDHQYESEGPGGGGGGGYIGATAGTFTAEVLGGLNGTTNTANMVTFPMNGATMGGDGIQDVLTNFTFTTADDTICSDSVKLIAVSNGTVPPGTTICWYDAMTGGDILATGDTFIVTGITQTTTFYVGTCPGIYKKPVTVYYQIYTVPIITGDLSICEGENTTLSVSGESGSIYSWSTGETDQSITVIPAIDTKYTVTSTKELCTLSDSVTVVVIPQPVAQVTGDTLISCSEVATLVASGGTNYIWNNGLTSSTIQVSAILGTYHYEVTVSNAQCTSTASIEVEIKDFYALYVPNAFTPNGDGLNDLFMVGYTGINEFNMKIFNRWGQLLFETNDPNTGWDGKYDNKIVEGGVYTYTITANNPCGLESKKNGYFILLR